eukprot:2138970-Pleurochrysis_carterae.AAC.1
MKGHDSSNVHPQHAITENSASGVDATRLAARGKAPAAKAFDSMNNIVAHTLSALTASVTSKPNHTPLTRRRAQSHTCPSHDHGRP